MAAGVDSEVACEVDREKIIESVKSFVNDLWVVNKSSKVTPLSLYHRLIEKTDFSKDENYTKLIGGFSTFFEDKTVKMALKTNNFKKIARGINIKWGDSERIYINISLFYNRADVQTRVTIAKHLTVIASAIDSNSEIATTLRQKIKSYDTPENKFVDGLMDKINPDMIDPETLSDPTTAIASLMSSGVVTDMLKGVGDVGSNKDLDTKEVLKALHRKMGDFISDDESDGEEDEEEIKIE